MAYNSLHDFVQVLEARRELKRVAQPVKAELEIAEIADRVMKSGGPALLFENVVGKNVPVLINAFGSTKRMAAALGVEDIEDIAHEIEKLLRMTKPPKSFKDKLHLLAEALRLAGIPPKKVKDGACQEVIHREPDLGILPVLTCWPGDGGPFITLPAVFSRIQKRAPETSGSIACRFMIRAPPACIGICTKSARAIIANSSRAGWSLRSALAATQRSPMLRRRLCLIRSMRSYSPASSTKRASTFVRAQTVDIEVPASADFVIEGYVDPTAPYRREGPFGDHTGFYSLADDYPVFHVTCITQRKNPIYLTTIVGRPPMEDAYIGKATERIFLPLLRLTFPEIVDMNLPVHGVFHNLAVVSIEKEYPAHARKIMHALWGMGQMMFTKILIVVDDDVNVQDLSEVTWVVGNHIDPKRDVVFVDGPVDVLDHAAPALGFGSKMGIDATRKWRSEGFERDWPDAIVMDGSEKNT